MAALACLPWILRLSGTQWVPGAAAPWVAQTVQQVGIEVAAEKSVQYGAANQ